MPSASRTRNLLLALACAVPATALAQTGCEASDSPLQCRLNNILHLLIIAAVVLAIVLVAVVILAVRTYRRNKKADIEKP